MATKRKMIIDCDVGTDDAQAILMVLAQTDVDVIAVTCVFGNSTLENSSRNVLRILKLCNRLDIPVYKGSAKSMLGNLSPESRFHGDDGLGDITFPNIDPIDMGLLQDEHAVNALVRLVGETPGEITLVTLGPLTNLAMALHFDESFGKHVKAVYSMGGNIEGKGNMTAAAECNYYCDPEAVHHVLNHLGQQLNIVPLEFCYLYSVTWEWYDRFMSSETSKARFMKSAQQKSVDFMHAMRSENVGGLVCDPLAMAVAIDPSIVTESRDVFICIELQGQLTRAQCVVDWKNKFQKPPNARIMLKADFDRFKELLYSSIAD